MHNQSLAEDVNQIYKLPSSSFYTENSSSVYTSNNCNCDSNTVPIAPQCTACSTCRSCLPSSFSDATQRRIWKASRVDQSQYLDSISALNVYTPPTLHIGVNWNQMSDRAVPGIVKRNVPSRGNSTKYSITRERPGAQSAPGVGVDVKHGSYHRYLERLKGKGPARSQKIGVDRPLYGNKTKYYGISNNSTYNANIVGCYCN